MTRTAKLHWINAEMRTAKKVSAPDGNLGTIAERRKDHSAYKRGKDGAENYTKFRHEAIQGEEQHKRSHQDDWINDSIGELTGHGKDLSARVRFS
jgi:hypothetical protein